MPSAKSKGKKATSGHSKMKDVVAMQPVPPLSYGRLKIKPGDTLWEIDHGRVIWQSNASKKQRAGTLTLCKCVGYDWSCTTGPGGDTTCKQVCVEWECEELPAVFVRR